MDDDNFSLAEPQWILEKPDSGPMVWRRNLKENSRVKFRHDVEIKEFYRKEYEMEEIKWTTKSNYDLTSLTYCVFCILLTIMLPWYVLLDSY